MNENSNSLGIFTEKVSLIACPSCDVELDISEFEVFEDIDCPACGESLKVPGRLGNFILIEELGRGAMGCVYLAMDESLNRLVALKVIRKEYGKDPKMLESVQREAQAMATLNHRNIAQVYSFGRIEEQPYFVMELLQGERLDEMMENGHQIDEIRALEIAIDVSQGLEAAEQAGLTHGDIKPANLLMDIKGVAKVVDFGLAKFMEPGQEIEVWGTPYYIAPEKAKKIGEDSRSDQYSLGGTIFHSLAGHPPFDAETPTKVVVAALKEDTPLIRASNPGVTEKTEQVIHRMMAKNPNRRYPTYASLLSDLKLALKAAKDAKADRELQERLEEERKNKKTSPLVITMLAVTAVCFIGLGLMVFLQSRSNGTQDLPKYDGPVREELAPFLRAEERNLNEAVADFQKGNLASAEKSLAVVYNLIPDKHVAQGWTRFFEAGMRLYAQDFDEARLLLEEVAQTEDMIFDTKGDAPEDPRILAQVALGKLDFRDLQKAVRKAEYPYYAHLGEMAIGYGKLLKGDRNGSARHFRAYSEFSTPGLDWPYVLKPISNGMHLPREMMKSPEPKESGTDILNDMAQPKTPAPEANQRSSSPITSQVSEPPGAINAKRKTAAGFPAFFVTPVRNGTDPLLTEKQQPDWAGSGVNSMASSNSPDVVFTEAYGIHPSTAEKFSITAKVRITKFPNPRLVVFHFGAVRAEGANPGELHGLVLEFPPGQDQAPQMLLQLLDGQNQWSSQEISLNEVNLNEWMFITFTWREYGNSEGGFRVAVNNEQIFEGRLQRALFPDPGGPSLVAVGKSIGDQGQLIPAEGLEVQRIYLFKDSLGKEKIYLISDENLM